MAAPLTDPTALQALLAAPGYAKGVLRSGAICSSEQMMRELFENGCDAGATRVDIRLFQRQAVRPDGTTVTVDKLGFVDNGTGITPTVRDQHLLVMDHSGNDDGQHFGLGAKITALRGNPGGLEYISLTAGATHAWRMRVAQRDGTFYLVPLADGALIEALDPADPLVPKEVRAAGHGTAVVLWGETADEDYKDRVRAEGRKGKHVTQYLNGRYLHLPTVLSDGPVVLYNGAEVSGSADAPSVRGHRVHGLGHWLAATSEHSGTVQLSDATVHWYLRADRGTRHNDDQVLVGQLVGLLYRNEVHDTRSDRAGAKELRPYGVLSNKVASRLTLLVEPDPAKYGPDPSRMYLMRRNPAPGVAPMDLPRDRWGREFSELMPDAVADALEAATESGTEAGASREDLAKYFSDAGWLVVNRYAPSDGPTTASAVDSRELDEHAPGRRPSGDDGSDDETDGRDDGRDDGDDPAEEKERDPKVRHQRRLDKDGAPVARTGRNAVHVGDIPEILWTTPAETDVFDGYGVVFHELTNTLYFNAEFGPWSEVMDFVSATKGQTNRAVRAQRRAAVEFAGRRSLERLVVGKVLAARMRLQNPLPANATDEDRARHERDAEAYKVLLSPLVLSEPMWGDAKVREDAAKHGRSIA